MSVVRGMYNLLWLEYSDEILKTLVVVVCLFHDKYIGIDFRLVNCLLHWSEKLRNSAFYDFHPIAAMLFYRSVN